MYSNWWAKRIGKEVASQYQTHAEQEAATEFVRRSRLSIANAFERRLCRKDVVVALTTMFEQSNHQLWVNDEERSIGYVPPLGFKCGRPPLQNSLLCGILT